MQEIRDFFTTGQWRTFIEEHFNWTVIIGTAVDILLILLFGWVAAILFGRAVAIFESRLIRKGQEEGEPPSEASKRVETITRLLRQVFTLVLWLVIALVIMMEFGVDVGPVIAGAGILGLAVGFGAQNMVRDIIAGFFIIIENQVRVGDVAKVNGTGGLVEEINFRTIILRDLEGVVHVFPNGTIDTLSNLTKDWSGYVFDIGVAYKEDTDKVVATIRSIAESLQEDPKIGRHIVAPVEIFGVDKFDDSAVVIKGRIKTKPIKQWEVGREFLRRVKYAFDEAGIEIPFPHTTIYTGEECKPFPLQILGDNPPPRSQTPPAPTLSPSPQVPSPNTPTPTEPAPMDD